jgi:transketolase
MKELIKKIVEIVYKSKEGHIPSSLSILDILYVFYKNLPNGKLILSKGHASVGLYTILEHFNLLEYDLDTFCQYDSNLGGHPSDKIQNVIASTGSLGHGLPIGVGMAIGYKIQKIESNIYVLIGDGESNEGTIWESALLASQHKLNNLYCIMDYNRSGDRALKIDDVISKFISFGWDCFEINGHDQYEIKQALLLSSDKPIFILANTIKGHGIKIMENNPEWHHKIPTETEFKKILEEIK